MAIDQLGRDLEALGVSGGDLRCLSLLPQIYVGWSSPARDLPALEALLDATAHSSHLHPACASVARGWLFEEPTRAQFQSAFALLRVLCRATPEPIITSSDLLEAMLWAVRAARIVQATPPAWATTLRELQGSDVRHALNDLEGWLELDTSHLWLDLLSDDAEGVPAPVSPEPRSPEHLRNVPAESEMELEVMPFEEHDDEPSALLLRMERAVPIAEPFPLRRRIG
jgi:hypothetical protein